MLHRLREVRLRQEVACRTMGLRLGMTPAQYRDLERSDSDITLSQLMALAECLHVPVAELVCDDQSNELQRLRGFVLRVVKTANTMIDRLEAGPGQNLALELRREAVEMMPEAAAVDGTYPNRRNWDEQARIGKIAEHPVPFGDEANFYQSSVWQDS